ALAGVTEPHAVPSVWAVFGRSDAVDQARAVQILGQIDAPAATRALAVLALAGRSPDVRKSACETLSRRDPRDTVSLLMGLLAAPIRYEVRPVGGPGAPGVLFVEGERFNVRRLYTVPPLPESTIRRLIDPATPPEGSALLAATLGDIWVRLAS